MNGQAPLRIGIVGTGAMGRAHAAAWQATPARLVGFVSRDPASLLALRHNARVFDSVASILPHIDALIICSPTPQHAEQTLAAAAAGVHIVCEKPIARTLDDALLMRAECQRAGIRLLIAHVLRYFPDYAAAHEALRAGTLGTLQRLSLKRAGAAPEQPWFANLDASGGPLLDLMIHDFDYARWISGDVAWVEARWSGGFTAHARVTLGHVNGSVTEIEGGWHLSPGAFETHLQITGTIAAVEASSDDPPTASAQASTLDAVDPYVAQARDFYAALSSGHAPRVSAEDGIEALRIALAAMRAAESSQRIPVHRA